MEEAEAGRRSTHMLPLMVSSPLHPLLPSLDGAPGEAGPWRGRGWYMPNGGVFGRPEQDVSLAPQVTYHPIDSTQEG